MSSCANRADSQAPSRVGNVLEDTSELEQAASSKFKDYCFRPIHVVVSCLGRHEPSPCVAVMSLPGLNKNLLKDSFSNLCLIRNRFNPTRTLRIQMDLYDGDESKGHI